MARLWDLKPGWTLHWLEDGDNIAVDDFGTCVLFLPTLSAEGDVATTVVDGDDAYNLIVKSVKSKNNRSRKAIKVDLDGGHLG